MKVANIFSCCTAVMLSSFRFDELGYGDAVGPDNAYPGMPVPETKEALLAEMLKLKNEGKAMVIAFTNDKQVKANAFLKDIGFKSTKWATKTAHKNTRLKLWWFALDRLEE
jgi:hypothetical protein